VSPALIVRFATAFVRRLATADYRDEEERAENRASGHEKPRALNGDHTIPVRLSRP